MPNTDPQKIEEILTRGVENIYPSKKELEKVLLSEKKLRIYNGIDPTGKLHIGHGAVLNKLRQLQDLGHEIIVLIGDFTATIGDPTGKSQTRRPLTKKEVLLNASNYKKQIGKILDLKKTKFLYNSKWTNRLTLFNFLQIASNFTVARLLERDMFQERIKAGVDIHAHEFLYPIFQAYDSIAMDVDMEVGGNDQTFNMLAGRILIKKLKNKEKFVLTTKLLVDAAGKKMGKTEGNMVNLDDAPNDMFGKIMSWPDELIGLGFELCTRVSASEFSSEKNPRDLKAKLAKEIVKIYYGEKEAQKAEEEFNKVHRDRELPEEMPVFETNKKEYFILDLLCLPAGRQATRLANSKNEAKRLIEQGAVEIIIGGKSQKISDWRVNIQVEDGMIIKVGNRRFVKLKI